MSDDDTFLAGGFLKDIRAHNERVIATRQRHWRILSGGQRPNKPSGEGCHSFIIHLRRQAIDPLHRCPS